MRHVVVCDLSGSTVFFDLLIKGTISEEKKLLSVNVCFSLQALSETFIFIIRTERCMIITIYWSSCKVFLSVLSLLDSASS